MNFFDELQTTINDLKKKQQTILDGYASLLANQEAIKQHLDNLLSIQRLEAKQYSVPFLIKHFATTRKTVYRWFKQGLKWHNVGKRRYVYASELQSFINKSNKLKAKYSKLLDKAA